MLSSQLRITGWQMEALGKLAKSLRQDADFTLEVLDSGVLYLRSGTMEIEVQPGGHYKLIRIV